MSGYQHDAGLLLTVESGGRVGGGGGGGRTLKSVNSKFNTLNPRPETPVPIP